MSKEDNGGPVFPQDTQTARAWAVFENAKKPLPKTDYVALIESLQTGMTLRDYFAAKALQGMGPLPGLTLTQMNGIANDAYQIADAMLRERIK